MTIFLTIILSFFIQFASKKNGDMNNEYRLLQCSMNLIDINIIIEYFYRNIHFFAKNINAYNAGYYMHFIPAK